MLYEGQIRETVSEEELIDETVILLKTLDFVTIQYVHFLRNNWPVSCQIKGVTRRHL